MPARRSPLNLVQAVEQEQIGRRDSGVPRGENRSKFSSRWWKVARSACSRSKGSSVNGTRGFAPAPRSEVSHSIGVERSFLLNSPRIDHIEVLRRGSGIEALLSRGKGRAARKGSGL